MNIESLDKLLDIQPVAAVIHPASLLYLSSMPRVLTDPATLLAEFDIPIPIKEERILVLGSMHPFSVRLPVVSVEHDPFTSKLNSLLPGGYEFLRGVMFCQSQIAKRIAEETSSYDTIVTLFVDGLSYTEFRDYIGCEPCLVDGLTTTPDGFSRLIGNPPISSRLFKRGFHTRLGFSYWDRDNNKLTDTIFDGIPNTKRVTNFDDVLSHLETSDLKGAYIQIVRAGLDHLSHSRNREKPPVQAVVDALRQDIDRLIHLLQTKPGRSKLYVSSDHGILWKHLHSLQAIDESAGRVPARYYERHPGNKPFLPLVSQGNRLYCLTYPYIRRQLAADEAGCHGGLSYQESIIPFCSVEINT